jgi:hypothetical protein
MRKAGKVAQIEKRNAFTLMAGKPERKRPPGSARRRRVDNIKMDLEEIRRKGWYGLDWTGSG